MRDSVIASLKQLLIHDLFVELTPDEIDQNAGLQSVLGLDSVSFVELRVLCERHFNLQIRDAEYTPENFGTLNRLADLIVRKQSEQSPTCA